MSRDDLDPTKFRIVYIRGKKYTMPPGVRIPKIYFHPDTPKNVVWLDPS